MPGYIPDPTPYPDINAILRLLLSEVQSIIGDRFVGMYLYGSLATGDFDPQRSDIDFVVVTTRELPDDMHPTLEAMHGRITASGLTWAAKLEGAYVPLSVLRRHDPNGALCPYINEGRFRVGRLDSDWIIQRHVIRECGVVVAGPAPRTLIDPVQPNDLRRAVRGTLREWWAPMLHNPDPRLNGGEYQAYAVLTMCRALYTLRYGTIASKPVSAHWAQAALDRHWAPLIAGALAWQVGARLDDEDAILSFIQYALDYSQESEVQEDQARDP